MEVAVTGRRDDHPAQIFEQIAEHVETEIIIRDAD
jgi:hypothetical protein